MFKNRYLYFCKNFNSWMKCNNVWKDIQTLTFGRYQFMEYFVWALNKYWLALLHFSKYFISIGIWYLAIHLRLKYIPKKCRKVIKYYGAYVHLMTRYHHPLTLERNIKSKSSMRQTFKPETHFKFIATKM